MKSYRFWVALSVAGWMSYSATVAFAQDAPLPAETPRCGGLLCDLGIIGQSKEPPLPCRDFLCRAMGQKDVVASPQQAAVVAPAPEVEKPKPARKKVAKHVVKKPVTPDEAVEKKSAT